MIYLVVSLLGLGILAALLGLSTRQGTEVEASAQASCATCNGENDKCEQVCMMEAAVKAVEYFDDEELDSYKGRPSDSYSDDEVGQFGEVLYTLRPEDVRPWLRSLQLRGVSLPDELKDEMMLLAGN